MNFSYTRGAPFLEIGNVSHSYGHKAALKDVSLEVKQSEVLALLGPSGSGKSTLLAIIAGIVKPSSGKVVLDGRNLLNLPPASRRLGMVFQDFALWPHMTVAQNVAFPLHARRCPPDEVKMRVEETLRRVDLQGFEGRRPHELSGGQQQRVALARAIVAQTQLLLLDEPLSALDPATQSIVRSELAEILRKLQLTTIIVTHDREEAFELANRIAVLVEGRVQQHATPEETYERPANLTVARFMGTNVLSVHVLKDGSAVLRNNAHARLKLNSSACEGAAHLVIVPEQTRVTGNFTGATNVLSAHLVGIQYRGGEYRIRLRVGDHETAQIIEARSKEKPREDRLLVQMPAEAIHVIHDVPIVPLVRTATETVTRSRLIKVAEKIA
jgi:ABC-type Fe3+/spermidine/putrescine transport system ATPase subunit